MGRRQLYLISAAFGLSGFAALSYQVTWIKELSTFFGIQVYSTTTVLAAFMAGLALGSWLFGRLADRIRHPLRLFAFMEFGIALFAILFPYIRDLIANLYLLMVGQTEPLPLFNQLYRFSAAFPFLLLATSLMGGTLPVLTRGLTRELDGLGLNVSTLYGTNNLGAFLGGFFTGYLLIQAVGIQHVLWIAAALNALNGVLVLIFSPAKLNGLQHRIPANKSTSRFAIRNNIYRTVLWVFALEGFTTLAYEIIWTRIIHEFSFDKTSYFYTTIIISFVGGLSIGGYLFTRLIPRLKNPVRTLAHIELAIGITCLILLSAFIAVAPAFHTFQEAQQSWFSKVASEQLLIFLLVTPPVILMGFTLPLVSVMYNNSGKQIGQRMGILGSLDTIGSFAGALVAGFLLIPLLGTLKAFLLVAAMNISLGLVMIAAAEKRSGLKALAGILAVIMLLLPLLTPGSIQQLNKRWNIVLKDPVIYYNEGPSATVAVTKYRDTHAALSINGAIVAYTIPYDVQVHKLLATLPWLYSEDPSRALVIGLGIGITANSLLRAGVPDIEVAEISPGVIDASLNVFGTLEAEAAADANIRMDAGAGTDVDAGAIADKDADADADAVAETDERLSIRVEDGRALLFRSEGTFDIITSNSIHPRLGNTIYTHEFYKLCLEKLSKGGVVCQWLPTNWMSWKEIRSLIGTFTDVFEWSSLWFVNDGHTLLLGSAMEPDLNYGMLKERFFYPDHFKYLSASGYLQPSDILKHFWIADSTLEVLHEDVALNTDNQPRIEYSRVISRGPNITFLEELVRSGHKDVTVPCGPAEGTPDLDRLRADRQMLQQQLESYIKLIN